MVEDSGRTESGKARPERKGMKYSTMDARYKKTHLCDRTRLPEGSVIISTEMRKVFDRVCYVVEHICCLAHARAKFKYAQEQGQDERATYFQIFNYRNDGRYSIDNSIAERCIRPLTRERSSSIHFASHRGAEVSAIFHTVFSTCRMVGVSALDYLKKFFEAMLAGRTDYENLLLSTIGLRS